MIIQRQHRCCCLQRTRYCYTDVTKANLALTEVVHRERRCCCSLPLTCYCPTDANQDVPASTEDVHRQHNCCRQGGRAAEAPPMSPRLTRPPPRPFTDSIAAATYRGPVIALPMSPRPFRPLPWSFTGSAAAGARRGHRCRPGRPGPYHGRSPAAPLLVPAADTDVAQVVPASPRPFADSTATAGSGPAVTASTVVVHRQHRCCWCPPLTRWCPADANQAVPAATDVVHRQNRCCCLPRSHRCSIDVAQAVPAATDVVHRQHRCYDPPHCWPTDVAHVTPD